MYEFQPSEFLPSSIFARLTDIRVSDPERSRRAAEARKRRQTLTLDGRLNVLAADHPARRVTAIGANPLGMADRHQYFARTVRVLMSDLVDGVMATMDVLEDLLTLHDLLREAGGPPFLDGRVLIASLNRGGLAQASWELDDPMTGATPATCAAWNLDGGKILLRLSDQEPDCLRTLEAAALAISELNALGLPTFLEPLPVEKTDRGYKVQKAAEPLAKIVGVASALGDSSRFLWLKAPYCEHYEIVAHATSLPILLLGGESAGSATPFLEEVAAGLAAGANVRGALVGRNVLYPGGEDPLTVAEAVGAIVHKCEGVEQAIGSLADHRGIDMDWVQRHFRNAEGACC